MLHRPPATRRVLPLVLLASLGILLLPALASGQAPPPGITITELGTLGGAQSYAAAINEQGQVVGSSSTTDGQSRAFLWENGRMTALPTPKGGSSIALSINNRGQIAGQSCSYIETDGGAQWTCRATVWENGRMTSLATPQRGQSVALDINDQGQVVGQSCLPATGQETPCHAVLWEHGRRTNLGTEHAADAINEQGQVITTRYLPSAVGDGPSQAFLWEHGRVTELGTLGGRGSLASDINDRGQVVGQSETPEDQVHAFLWENGRMTDLGTLGGRESFAYGINNHGQVVGRSRAATSGPTAVLWENGRLTSLGTLGGRESSARDINEQGQAVGYSLTPTGEEHAVIWTLPTAPQTPPQLSLSATCVPDEYDVRQVLGTLTIVTQAPVRLDALQGTLEGTTGARISFDAPVGRMLAAGTHHYNVRAQRWTATSPHVQLRLTVTATLGGQPQTAASAVFAPCAPEPPVPCTQPNCAGVPEIRFNVYLPALALETP